MKCACPTSFGINASFTLCSSLCFAQYQVGGYMSLRNISRTGYFQADTNETTLREHIIYRRDGAQTPSTLLRMDSKLNTRRQEFPQSHRNNLIHARPYLWTGKWSARRISREYQSPPKMTSRPTEKRAAEIKYKTFFQIQHF